MPKLPERSEAETWALAYSIALSLTVISRGLPNPGYEEKFAENADAQARALADRAVKTLKEKRVL